MVENKILSDDIINFLNKEEISFECSHKLNKQYIIASLFMPIENGFYFFLGAEVPDSIANSLLLLRKGNYLELKNNNEAIYIDGSPQEVYYKLLSSKFKSQSNGLISKTAIIHPEAKIGKNVQIDHYAVVGNVFIEDNVIIRSHCYIHDNSVLGENVTIENHSIIGAQGVAWIWNEQETEKIIQPQLGGVEIHSNASLGANTIVVRGSLSENSIIGKNTLFAPGCRIGHGTIIGDYVHFANNVITGGNTKIGDYSFIGSSAVFRPKVNLHKNTIVGTGAVVIKNTTQEGKTLIGVPAVEKETKEHPSGMPKPKNNSK